MRQLADQRIDLTQGEARDEVALKVAAQETVGRSLDRTAETTKRRLVQLRPRLRRRALREKAHRFTAVREHQHNGADATVPARRRVAHHRPLAVVDLGVLARSRRDQAEGFGGRLPRSFPTKRRTPSRASP